MGNFDLKKYLTENKLTQNSRIDELFGINKRKKEKEENERIKYLKEYTNDFLDDIKSFHEKGIKQINNNPKLSEKDKAYKFQEIQRIIFNEFDKESRGNDSPPKNILSGGVFTDSWYNSLKQDPKFLLTGERMDNLLASLRDVIYDDLNKE